MLRARSKQGSWEPFIRENRLNTSIFYSAAVLGSALLFSASASAGPNVDNHGYYTMRPDFRRCAYPMCGGDFVKAVNKKRTRCADGQKAADCYVAEVDWDALGLSEDQLDTLRSSALEVVFQGELETVEINNHDYGRFVPSRAFMAAHDEVGQGKFFRLFDSGIRCVTTPCPTVNAGKLNTRRTVTPDHIQLGAVGMTDAQLEDAHAAIASEELVVTGRFRKAFDWSTWSFQKTFRATQAYLPFMPEVGDEVLCQASGCSGQICSSEPVVSTCEWRPEYECIRHQICEAQADGACGWTPTEESAACFDDLQNPRCPDQDLKDYVATDLNECMRIRFVCEEGKGYFSDDCGCGCM